MPYHWTPENPHAPRQELKLWPHNSLPPAGFAAFILGTFTMALIPLLAMLGTALLWGLLPFILIAIAGLYFALQRNSFDRSVEETLTLTPDDVHLVRRNPKGDTQEWQCRTYWARLGLHKDGGPVPFYVTLSGAGREVEIGAFLSEDERKSLHDELATRLARIGR